MDKLETLKSMKEELMQNLDTLKLMISDEVTIDEIDLDGESLRTPKLHSKWIGVLSDEAIKHKQINSLGKKLYLERWKYWQGKQTDKYYAEYGIVHEKILKTDIDIYLKSDDYLIAFNEVMDVQDQIVSLVERTIKEIGSRTFHIRAAIDWRRFSAGN